MHSLFLIPQAAKDATDGSSMAMVQKHRGGAEFPTNHTDIDGKKVLSYLRSQNFLLHNISVLIPVNTFFTRMKSKIIDVFPEIFSACKMRQYLFMNKRYGKAAREAVT